MSGNGQPEPPAAELSSLLLPPLGLLGGSLSRRAWDSTTTESNLRHHQLLRKLCLRGLAVGHLTIQFAVSVWTSFQTHQRSLVRIQASLLPSLPFSASLPWAHARSLSLRRGLPPAAARARAARSFLPSLLRYIRPSSASRARVRPPLPSFLPFPSLSGPRCPGRTDPGMGDAMGGKKDGETQGGEHDAAQEQLPRRGGPFPPPFSLACLAEH